MLAIVFQCPGRRLGLGSVGPELGHHAREVGAQHDLRRIGRARSPGSSPSPCRRSRRASCGRTRRARCRSSWGRTDRPTPSCGSTSTSQSFIAAPSFGAGPGIVPGHRARRALHRERRHVAPLRADVHLHARGQDDPVLRRGDRQVDRLPALGLSSAGRPGCRRRGAGWPRRSAAGSAQSLASFAPSLAVFAMIACPMRLPNAIGSSPVSWESFGS